MDHHIQVDNTRHQNTCYWWHILPNILKLRATKKTYLGLHLGLHLGMYLALGCAGSEHNLPEMHREKAPTRTKLGVCEA
jgi:hypothetical protein